MGQRPSPSGMDLQHCTGIREKGFEAKAALESLHILIFLV